MADYYELAADTELYKMLSNGALMHKPTGRIVANPPGGPDTRIRDSSHAVAMAEKRWNDYQEASWRAGVVVSRRDNKVDAYQWLLEKQWTLAGDIDKGRASTEAARFVRESVGLSQVQDNTGGSVTFSITFSGSARELADRLLGNDE